jgi:2-oxoisovalerate dehydrogenase E1 component
MMQPQIEASPASHSEMTLMRLYAGILKPRMIEERMLLLLRQGRVSKWFSGIGQEAIAVGSTMALHPNEYILPLHRNLGVFTSRNVPLEKLFAQWQGKESGFTKGRDRSFHFGTNDYRIVGMISHLGPQLCIADGIALANKLAGSQEVCLVYSGDGGTSEGDFHEAINVAAVWDLPVIFVIENNGWGLSTPSSQQFKCRSLADRAVGYGIEGYQIDGNDLLGVYDTIRSLAQSIRKKPRPVIVECMTFRMRGHEEASGVKYVPPEQFTEWEKKDPVKNYEALLLSRGILNAETIERARGEIAAEIDAAIEKAFALPEIVADTDREMIDVYRPFIPTNVAPDETRKSKKRFVDAVSDGLRHAMNKYQNLILMGQDIAEYGGVFKVTQGFLEEFGSDRVRNTPLCESAILGAALGLSIKGMKSMVEMQFADFVSCGFNQIVNNLAKIHYRWGQNADVVIRMPCGAAVGAGPFHSQCNEAWFFHTPGLKIVYPAFPYDAKGLLLSAFEDPKPVLFFEHKALYRSTDENIPDDYYNIEIGKARQITDGRDIAVITYGLGVHWALDAMKKHPEIKVRLLDLRTLAPLDWDAIRECVEATGKVLILHEDTMTGGIGAEIAAWIGTNCFNSLDAPVQRCAGLDTPVPFTRPLEDNFLARSRFEKQLLELAAY